MMQRTSEFVKLKLNKLRLWQYPNILTLWSAMPTSDCYYIVLHILRVQATPKTITAATAAVVAAAATVTSTKLKWTESNRINRQTILFLPTYSPWTNIFEAMKKTTMTTTTTPTMNTLVNDMQFECACVKYCVNTYRYRKIFVDFYSIVLYICNIST